MSRRIDLTGQRFGRLTAIKDTEKSKNKSALWICECDCGNTKIVKAGDLKQRRVQSCGCLNSERASQTLHDFNVTHGESRTKLYIVWNNMMQRVLNKNNTQYKNYGGRGIEICEEWKKYENFKAWALINGYDSSLTIDREDNDGNYCPENCRWVSRDVQNNNKRQSRKIKYNGQTKTITQWAKELGINRELLRDRINAGWSIKQAIEIPTRKKEI